MKKFVLLNLLLSFYCGYTQIQKQLEQLKTSKDDTIKVKLLSKIGNYYKTTKYDSAVFYFEASKKLSKKLNYKIGEFQYGIDMGDVLVQTGKYDAFLKLNKQGLGVAKVIGSKNKQSLSYKNIGSAYFYLFKLDSCIQYYQKAQIISESINNNDQLVSLYSNLCSVYAESNLLEKSLEYGFKALALQKKGFGKLDDLPYVLASISSTYLTLKDNEKALFYANETIKECRKVNNSYIEQITIGNIITIKTSQKKYSELFYYLRQLDKVSKKTNTPENNANLLLQYSKVNYYNGNMKLAEKYAFETLKISEPNNLEFFSKSSYIMLNKIEAALGNYDLSEIYGVKRDSLNKKQLNKEIASNIQELEKKYETQKKQTEIIKLKTANEKKSTLNKILIGSSIGLLLIGFLGYRNFRNKRKLQNLKISELEKDKQLLAIDAMLKGQEEERSRIAKDLHDGLGGLLSGTKLSFTNMKENLLLTPENAILFEKSIGMLDTTIADLRKVAHNLMPEALVKFGLNDALKDFCSSIQLASSKTVDYQKIGLERKIGSTAETFIYRIIQELVNNAVKHAQASEILVQIAYNNDKISITVEDNGKGYDKNLAPTGDGLDNIAYRVKYLSGTIDTVTSPNNGTSVNIELNV